MFSFAKFLLRRDPISVNYRGSETHQTWLGSLLSLGINFLVVFILA